MKTKKQFFKFKSKTKGRYLLGLEVRGGFINLVGLSWDGSRCRLEVCRRVRQDSQQSAGDVVCKATKIKFIALALPYSRVKFKEVSMAKNLLLKEKNDFLVFRVLQDTGWLKKDIVFDWWVINGEGDAGGADVDVDVVQLVATQKKHIKDKLKEFEPDAFELRVIDVDIFALERAVRYQLKSINGLVALINIDCDCVFILVLDSKKIVCMKEYAFDVDDLKFLEQIVEQVELKLDKVQSSLPQSLSKLILAGEKASLFGLVDAVGFRSKIKTVLANPFLNMELSSEDLLHTAQEMAGVMLVSCGLALRVSSDG